MIRHAMSVLADAGCVVAQCWAIEKTRTNNVLRRAGLRLKRRKVNFVLSPEASTRHAMFYDKDSWLLTQGDGNDL